MPRLDSGIESALAKSGPSGITIMTSRILMNWTALIRKRTRRSDTGPPGGSPEYIVGSRPMLAIIHIYTVVLYVAVPALLFFLKSRGQLTDAPAWPDLATDPLAIGMVALAGVALVS